MNSSSKLRELPGLEEVRSISQGEVVHCSDAPGASNYGRYLVIRHDWGEGPFFSLYAHLSRILAKPGDKVGPGTVVAAMARRSFSATSSASGLPTRGSTMQNSSPP